MCCKMPNSEYENLKTTQSVIDTVSLAANFALKIADHQTLDSVKKIKKGCGLMDRILKFLSQFNNKIIKGIYSFLKNNKFINGAINLADKYLSVHADIQKLKFYKFLSGCGIASCITSFIWWLLEKVGVIPKKKSLWLKILDAGISIFGYVTGLIVDILDIIYNPFILRKVAASVEIVFSTVSLGIHIYTLIKY